VTTTPTQLLVLAALFALAPACAFDDEPDTDDDFRIINGTDVDGKNGAVQMKVPKKKETITDPKKAHWYCTGALIAEDCVITAGHCIENVGAADHLAGAEWWHPAKTLNGDNGRPIPAEGDVVAKPKVIKVLGTQHRDLAVIKLDKKLPGPFLALAKDTPALESKIHVLGNGTIEKDEYAHRETDMKLVATAEAAADLGYVSLELARIGKDGGIATFGDSGGPALFDGKIVGLGSRLAKKDVSVYYASTTSAKSRAWLVAAVKEVCDLEIGDTGTTGEDGGTGDAEEGGTGSDSWTSGSDSWTSGGDSWSEGGSYTGGGTIDGGSECEDDPWFCDVGDDGTTTTSGTTTWPGDESFTDDGATWDLGSGGSDDAGSDSWDDGATWDLGGGMPVDEPVPLPLPGLD